jgi:hypothetical protein
VRIHLAGEHALELELFHFRGKAHGIGFDFNGGAFVVFGSRQFQEFAGIGKSPRQPIQARNHQFEPGALLAEFLRAVGAVPDSRLFELARYFLQSLLLVVVIKDTPSRSRFAPRVL